MSNANALFLLADHIKLSLLERKRAHSLDNGGGNTDSQDGHISRSLDQFRDGLEGLKAEKIRLEEDGDEGRAATIADTLPDLEKQLETLTSQFHGFSAPPTTNPDTLTQSISRPNKPSLRSPSTSSPAPANPNPSKSVRFTDRASTPDPADTAALFSRPYRDDPEPSTYRDETSTMENTQIHAYHQDVMRQQDEQLDALSSSIGRQRELSMQIGDELDGQAALLEEGERRVDRHQSRLDRARRQVNKVTAGAASGEFKQIGIIVLLILILVLLIAVLK